MDVRVLVVDDNEAVRRQVMQDLRRGERLGPNGERLLAIEVDQSEGMGEHLRNLISRHSYDLAVVDYHLMSGNGFDVLQTLAPADPLRETKVVVYTGLAQYQRLDKALEALRLGAFTFVRKGKEPDEFGPELQRALRTIWLERNRAMVGNFVDKELRAMLSDPAKMAMLRDGCIVDKGFLFLDITGSTPFVKFLQGSIDGVGKVGPVLRELLSWISCVIQSKGGIVDKFIGDEVMAYFRDSTDTARASKAEAADVCARMVEAAWEIRQGFHAELDRIYDRLKVLHRPQKKPWIKCVINYDRVIWAVLGSERYLDLTILTDAVVRTARVMQHAEKKVKLLQPGDIYLLEGVWSRLQDARFALDPDREVDLRDFGDEKIKLKRVSGHVPKARRSRSGNGKGAGERKTPIPGEIAGIPPS